MFSFLGFSSYESPKYYMMGWKRGNKWDNIIKEGMHNKYYKNFMVFKSYSNIYYIDLRNRCPLVYDQGNLGSCTANALAFGYEYTEMIENEKNIFIPSRLFIYYNERNIEDSIDTDSGAQLFDGISSLHINGVCKESDWIYDITKYKDKPSDKCYSQALNHRIDKFYAVEQKLDQLRSSLILGFPVIFGFVVYKSFQTEQVQKTGIMTMPVENDIILGGHAVSAVGFDDKKKVFIIRNSWGVHWGDNGYFYMPYDYILNPNLASDFWCITHSFNKKQIKML